jgi:hypothetical protein
MLCVLVRVQVGTYKLHWGGVSGGVEGEESLLHRALQEVGVRGAFACVCGAPEDGWAAAAAKLRPRRHTHTHACACANTCTVCHAPRTHRFQRKWA